jgi:hypothetical protein
MGIYSIWHEVCDIFLLDSIFKTPIKTPIIMAHLAAQSAAQFNDKICTE